MDQNLCKHRNMFGQ